MYSEQMYELGSKSSRIREIFEYAKKRAAEIGPENVFDFSIGNPSVPAPETVKEAVEELLKGDPVQLHGYTSAAGDMGVRQALADDINKRYQAGVKPELMYMTAGAAAALCCAIRGLACPGDEFIAFVPFFPEYTVFVNNNGGKLVSVGVREKDFQIDLDILAKSVNEHTKAIIVNSPNNPSGVVYTEETICALAKFMKEKSEEYGHPIYLIADEPYRELVYDDLEVPYLVNYYDNTIVCYSYSKSLSLPGERIGYYLVSPKMEDADKVYAALAGAGRSLGYTCAPSMFQFVVGKCAGQTSDIGIYKANRDRLYDSLTSYGFECIKPDGAFYLFMKAAEADADAFCERAKKYDLLLVPCDSFCAPGYVRICYCVQPDMIERALPGFKKLAEEYSL